jgi:hypothetical protein
MHEMAKRKAGTGPNLLKYYRPEEGERQEPARTTAGAGIGGEPSVGGEPQCLING